MPRTPKLRLAGKVVIVTGAASGLGKESALAAAAEGARIVACDVNAAGAKTVAREIAAAGGEAVAATVDVSDMVQTQKAAKLAVKTYGRIDALMNFAGIVINGSATAADQASWDKVIAVNLTGTWLMNRAVLPAMQETGGAIVNIASVGGMVGVPGIAAYAASKAGVIGLTRQIATDYAQFNVRANAICPGTVPTPLVVNHYIVRGEAEKGKIEEGLKAATKRYPLRRLGKESEIAALAVFLASDEAAFITGAAVPIDGGLTAVAWQVGQ